MSLKELREQTDEHLKTGLAEKLKHLFDLRSQAVTEKLEDPSQLRKARKEIAQFKTLMRERQIKATKAAAPAPVAVTKPVSKTAAKRAANKFPKKGSKPATQAAKA